MSSGSNENVKGTRTLTSGNSLANSIYFAMETMLRNNVNTAEVVKVVRVYPGGVGSPAGAPDMTGHVDVLPLVCLTDARDNALTPATLYRLPYSRIQGGVAALVIDPVPGDIGLAVFTKRDSSNVGQAQEQPVQPGSFRIFDQADGFYIGGFLNKAPEIWLELKQNREAVLHAPVKVTVNTTDAVVNASAKTLINSPETELSGNLMVRGNVTWAGVGQGHGGQAAVFKGGINNTGGNIKSNNVTLEGHTHPGVERGGGNTDRPASGS